MNKRRLRIIKYVAIVVAVMVLAWGASAIAVYAVSSERVFDGASIDAVPRQRAAVVMGCVRTLPNGLNNLYFSRRIDAAAELYKAGKVDCLIVSGDNHGKSDICAMLPDVSTTTVEAVLGAMVRGGRGTKYIKGLSQNLKERN